METLKCGICYGDLGDAHMCPSCSQMGCYACFTMWLQQQGHPSTCPFCRISLSIDSLVRCRFVDQIREELFQNLRERCSVDIKKEDTQEAFVSLKIKDCEKGLKQQIRKLGAMSSDCHKTLTQYWDYISSNTTFSKIECIESYAGKLDALMMAAKDLAFNWKICLQQLDLLSHDQSALESATDTLTTARECTDKAALYLNINSKLDNCKDGDTISDMTHVPHYLLSHAAWENPLRNDDDVHEMRETELFSENRFVGGESFSVLF